MVPVVICTLGLLPVITFGVSESEIIRIVICTLRLHPAISDKLSENEDIAAVIGTMCRLRSLTGPLRPRQIAEYNKIIMIMVLPCA